jgi:hypothetical protein
MSEVMNLLKTWSRICIFLVSSILLTAMAPKILSAGLLVLASSLVGTAHPASAASSPKALVPRQTNSTSHYLDNVSDYVDSIYEDLWTINKEIYGNPELGYEEFEVHDLLTSFMEEQDGWNVTRSVGGVETAFKAVFDGEVEGPVVSFNAEYDALPELGHACGHNLIATASIGGALAAAEVMRDEGLPGKVILFGTPAEESLGGKIKMHEAGIFKDTISRFDPAYLICQLTYSKSYYSCFVCLCIVGLELGYVVYREWNVGNNESID